MQILHMCAKVFFTLHLHGFMEARVFLSKIGNCSLNNKDFTDFLKILVTDYFREMLIKLVQLMYRARAVLDFVMARTGVNTN